MTRTKVLTSPQIERVFTFIVDYKEAHDGLSPTIRQIQNALGISSTSVVQYYLDRLEEAGRIERVAFATRHIRIIGGAWKFDREAING